MRKAILVEQRVADTLVSLMDLLEDRVREDTAKMGLLEDGVCGGTVQLVSGLS